MPMSAMSASIAAVSSGLSAALASASRLGLRGGGLGVPECSLRIRKRSLNCSRKRALTDKQKDDYRIRIFGDDRHMTDLPRGGTRVPKLYAGRSGAMRK
jgi:hypothetical protein